VVRKTLYEAENGLVFVSDIDGGRLAEKMGDEMVQATSSCVAIRCLHEMDGAVELTLGPIRELAQVGYPEFDQMIETPNRRLMISGVSGEPLLQTDIPLTQTRVRVWRNHPVWPDKVVVGWG
jgi:hypothetical protein